MCMNCMPLIKAIDRYLQKADDDLTDALKREGYEHSKDTVDTINKVEDDLTDALSGQTDRLKKEMNDCDDLKEFFNRWQAFKDADTLGEDLRAIFAKHLWEFMPKYAEYYIKRTDRQLVCQRLSKRSQAWIDGWSEELGSIMQLNSHEEIQAILDDGIAEGVGIEEFAKRVLDSGIRDERYKARRASLTEVLTAHRAAQQEAFDQSPSVKEKEWMHTGDYRNEPRQNHVDMDGQRVPIDEPFELIGDDGGIYYPMFPGDVNLPAGERINCHCIMKPIVDEIILGMPLEERQRLQEEALAELDEQWEMELDEANRMKAGIEV